MHRFAMGLVGALMVVATVSAQGSSSLDPAGDLVEAWRAGDREAWPKLIREPASAARALLDSAAARVGQGSGGSATKELRALADLGIATPEIVGGLLGLIDEASEGQAAQILRTVGDLVSYVEDVEALQHWVDEHPHSRGIDRVAEVLEKQIGEFKTAPTEFGRLVTRLELRDVEGIDAWFEHLKSADFDACEIAAERLAEYGGAAKAAVPRLAELIEHPEVSSLVSWRIHAPDGYWASDLPHLGSGVRMVAADAVLAIAPSSREALVAHLYLLEHGEDSQRLSSVVALRERADDPGRLTTALVPCLRQAANRGLRREAMLTLATLGREARAAIPALEAVIAGGDPELQATAQATLRAIGAPR